MEKYGQYRDKGSGIAPFFSLSPQATNPLFLPWYIFLFSIRIPLVTFAWIVWLAIVQWTPAGGALRKANLWCVLGIPGVWWIDLQVDGVRRGSLSQTPRGRLPYPGTIIASSCTSPLDVLYLAAIFDPVFTITQPGGRLMQPVSLEAALASCFDIQIPASLNFSLVGDAAPLSDVVRQNKGRIIVVFPEATTSNARGILKFSPSLLSAARDTRIFPISLRYTPPDIVTPIPGWIEAIKFIWRLNSSPTHCIRVRIGAPVSLNTVSQFTDSPDTRSKAKAGLRNSTGSQSGYDANFFDKRDEEKTPDDSEVETKEEMDEEQMRLLDVVADTLARLGRVKRVGLGAEEKKKFVEAWSRRGKYRT